MTQQDLNQKLEDLRKEYRTAGKGLRRLIEVRAKLLKKRFEEELEENKNERKEEYDAEAEWEKLQKVEKDA